MKNKLMIIPFILLVWEGISSPMLLGIKNAQGSYNAVYNVLFSISHGHLIPLIIMLLIIPIASVTCSFKLASKEKKGKIVRFIYTLMTVVSVLPLPLLISLFYMSLGGL